jgi:hypothetical protein
MRLSIVSSFEMTEDICEEICEKKDAKALGMGVAIDAIACAATSMGTEEWLSSLSEEGATTMLGGLKNSCEGVMAGLVIIMVVSMIIMVASREFSGGPTEMSVRGLEGA